MSGVEKMPVQILKVFTLTAPGADVLPGPREIREWNEGAPDRWERFVRLLRDTFPNMEIDVWKVWEKQQRGALHAHGLIRGPRFIDMEVFRALAVSAGFGPRVGLEACKVSKGGVRGLLGYFSKYLLKAVEAWRSGSHVITASRGWQIDWKRRSKEKRVSEWAWISERDALPLLNYYVSIDGKDGRVDVLAPPEISP
jgi:hypothetical protein